MEFLIALLSIFAGVLVLFSIALLIALLTSTNRIIEINKQLMIIVAGKDAKPETLRALVAQNKAPLKNLKGIATGEKEDKKPVNKDYTLVVGGNRD